MAGAANEENNWQDLCQSYAERKFSKLLTCVWSTQSEEILVGLILDELWESFLILLNSKNMCMYSTFFALKFTFFFGREKTKENTPEWKFTVPNHLDIAVTSRDAPTSKLSYKTVGKSLLDTSLNLGTTIKWHRECLHSQPILQSMAFAIWFASPASTPTVGKRERKKNKKNTKPLNERTGEIFLRQVVSRSTYWALNFSLKMRIWGGSWALMVSDNTKACRMYNWGWKWHLN